MSGEDWVQFGILRIGCLSYELQPSDSFDRHPSGNGYIVANPERRPLWMRIEPDGTFRSSWVEPN
jgi:hypothetical protein